jgi:hypothetical protein
MDCFVTSLLAMTVIGHCEQSVAVHNRLVIASEARQSKTARSSRAKRGDLAFCYIAMDCFVTFLLAMTGICHCERSAAVYATGQFHWHLIASLRSQ